VDCKLVAHNPKYHFFFLSKFENINQNYNQNVNFISDFKAVLMSIEYVRNKEAQRHKSRNNKKIKADISTFSQTTDLETNRKKMVTSHYGIFLCLFSSSYKIQKHNHPNTLYSFNIDNTLANDFTVTHNQCISPFG